MLKLAQDLKQAQELEQAQKLLMKVRKRELFREIVLEKDEVGYHQYYME